MDIKYKSRSRTLRWHIQDQLGDGSVPVPDRRPTLFDVVTFEEFMEIVDEHYEGVGFRWKL